MSDPGTKFQGKAGIYSPFYSARLSDYRLLGLVGQGQFAQVYCAVHRRTGRLFALKQIRHVRESAIESGLEETKEAALLRKLGHPNVVKCHAADARCLVLDYCEWGTLRSHLSTAFSAQFTPRQLPFSIAKSLIADILQGLSYLHQCGVIHSDLKPENILLTMPVPNRLTAKLSDFGCAHSISQPSQSTTEIGSPYYTAPERFEGHSSIASDLYSVGIMLYELLVGDRPFLGTSHQLRKAHKNHSPYIPNTLSTDIQQVLSTALHKQPSRRFASAAEMLNALSVLDDSLSLATAKAVESTAVKRAISLSTVDFSQRTNPVPAYGITSPVESLATLPQGCCIITEKSLHILTPKRGLMSVARFKQPCWISVSPNGKWFVALSKQDHLANRPASSRHAQGMIGKLSLRSGHQWRRSITLGGRLLSALLADVIKIIAVDSRYFIRVRTAIEPVRTYIECFTRRGQFVGELRFNQSITDIIPTAKPHQLIALSGEASSPVVVLINLKPFQIKTVRLPFVPERVHALAWGYLVVGEQTAALLDRNAQPVTSIKGLPNSRAIASLDSHRLLLANHATQPSLSVIDATALNLGLIF